MKVEFCDSHEISSNKARDIIMENLRQHKELMLCAATGGSPTRLYELLKDEYKTSPECFSGLQVIKLDEWGGVPMSYPGTCESYLREYVTGPLAIGRERYISFKSDADNPQAECDRIQDLLNCRGPIDICVLGLGMNGHIAFNEPNPFLEAHIHIATLSEQSMQHPMVAGEGMKPTYGLTLGMADIMRSRMVILLINGTHKQAITRELLTKKITTALPASFLWLHPNVICLIDKEAAGI